MNGDSGPVRPIKTSVGMPEPPIPKAEQVTISLDALDHVFYDERVAAPQVTVESVVIE